MLSSAHSVRLKGYYMARENKIYEFKSELLKDFAKYPDTKVSARKWCALRVISLKRKLKKEKLVKRKYVLKKLIKIYEDVK